MEEAPGLGFLSVAIGVEQQIQLYPAGRQLRKGIALDILQLPGVKLLTFQLIGPAVGEITPGKVDFVDVLPVFQDAIQESPVGILQSYHIFHGKSLL